MIYTNQQLDTAFSKIPKPLQDFVMSEVVSETIRTIAEEYNITNQKFDIFTLGIFAMLIGLESVENFEHDLAITFNFPEDTVHKIILDIEETLLDPARYVVENMDKERTSSDSEIPHTEEVSQEHISEPEIHPVSGLPITTTSQAPVTALLDDPEHGVHPHELSPIPLQKKGIPPHDPYAAGHDPYREPPEYELK